MVKFTNLVNVKGLVNLILANLSHSLYSSNCTWKRSNESDNVSDNVLGALSQSIYLNCMLTIRYLSGNVQRVPHFLLVTMSKTTNFLP